jgi:hypothetical protein
MGSEQEVEPSSIPVNTNLRSPHSSAATRLQAWTANDGGLFRYYLVFHGAGVWRRSLAQGLVGGWYCLSVDPRRRKFNAESAQLQAGRCDFGDSNTMSALRDWNRYMLAFSPSTPTNEL